MANASIFLPSVIHFSVIERVLVLRHLESLVLGPVNTIRREQRNPSDGANFPGLVVTRRPKMPDIRRSSLLEPVKIGSRRCRPNSVNRP
jgi:hypothetical protein